MYRNCYAGREVCSFVELLVPLHSNSPPQMATVMAADKNKEIIIKGTTIMEGMPKKRLTVVQSLAISAKTAT